MFSEEIEADRCVVDVADVHNVCAGTATAAEADIEGCALGIGCEWALKAARKLARNGL